MLFIIMIIVLVLVIMDGLVVLIFKSLIKIIQYIEVL